MDLSGNQRVLRLGAGRRRTGTESMRTWGREGAAPAALKQRKTFVSVVRGNQLHISLHVIDILHTKKFSMMNLIVPHQALKISPKPSWLFYFWLQLVI